MLKSVIVVGLVTCAAAGVFAQGQDMPKPGQEQANLARWVGTWKNEGTIQASPFGPAGKASGTETCKMFEGWHLVCDSSMTTPMGLMKGHTIITYDRAAKQYRYVSIANMPDAEIATGTRTPKGWTFTSTMEMDGKKVHSRFTITEASATAHTVKWEYSEDGKTWKVAMEGTSTKTS